ncbi:MAG TPA: ATP-binding protein, partial [Rudaea sp.]
AASVAAVAISAHQARQHIEDREQRFRSLFAYVPQAIFALDMQGYIVDCNEAAVKMSGFARHDLLHSSLAMTVSAEDRPRFATHLSLAASGSVQQIELTRQRPDGTRYLTVATKTPIIVDGALVGIFSIVRDVTAERANHLALEDAMRSLKAHNRELEEFAYVASHDLQEPLRKVRAFGDRLRLHLGHQADADALGYIERMRVAAERMQRLIDDLLAYSRVAKREMQLRSLATGDVVAGVLADLETRIEQAHAVIDCGPLPMVYAEETQLRQLFQNLIANAIKFSRPGVAPRITVRGETFRPSDPLDRRNWVRLTVSDNGIGFDNRYADRIFAAFQRLHGRGEYEGSGIGLAIVRRIAERHGGNVFASGVAGEGATFTIELPQPGPARASAQGRRKGETAS